MISNKSLDFLIMHAGTEDLDKINRDLLIELRSRRAIDAVALDLLMDITESRLNFNAPFGGETYCSAGHKLSVKLANRVLCLYENLY